MTDDLPIRLLAAIDWVAKEADEADWITEGPLGREDILRHCAAHRKIVEDLRELVALGPERYDGLAWQLMTTFLAVLAEGYDVEP